MELVSDLKTRTYYYDGKQFTIYAPKLGYYATMAAPPTNRAFLKTLYDKFGIELPLEDLFRWSDGDGFDVRALTAGYSAGTATLDGVATDHWAFRQGDYDWEVWIQQGDQPLPRKLTIVDRTDPAMPGYTARLSWTLNPTFAADDFTFTPGPDATRHPARHSRGASEMKLSTFMKGAALFVLVMGQIDMADARGGRGGGAAAAAAAVAAVAAAAASARWRRGHPQQRLDEHGPRRRQQLQPGWRRQLQPRWRRQQLRAAAAAPAGVAVPGSAVVAAAGRAATAGRAARAIAGRARSRAAASADAAAA